LDSILVGRLLVFLVIGYRISIDDFGAGYNSLMMLGATPYDIIKMDIFFVDRIDNIKDRELI